MGPQWLVPIFVVFCLGLLWLMEYLKIFFVGVFIVACFSIFMSMWGLDEWRYKDHISK